MDERSYSCHPVYAAGAASRRDENDLLTSAGYSPARWFPECGSVVFEMDSFMAFGNGPPGRTGKEQQKINLDMPIKSGISSADNQGVVVRNR